MDTQQPPNSGDLAPWTRRKFLLGLGAGSLALLAGCGGGAVPSSAPSAAAPASNAAASTKPAASLPASPAAASKPAASAASGAVASAAPKAEIAFWTYLPEIADYTKGLASQYTAKNPNTTVQVTLFEQRALDQKMAVALPAGAAGDIIDGGPQRKYFSAGFIAPLPDDVKKFATQDIKIPKSAVAFATENGALYTVPWLVGTQAMYYNKDHFDAAGISQPPSTVDQMLADARKLTQRDAKGNVTRAGLDLRLSGGGNGLTEKFWVQCLIPYGARPIKSVSNGKWHDAYDNPDGLNALKMYIDAVSKDKVVRVDMKHDAEGFELGTSSMFLRESWVIGDIAKNKPGLKYGVFLMPKGPKGWGMVTFWEGLAVPKASKNQQAAWDFVRFCLSPEAQVQMISKTGWIPTRTDVDYASVYQKQPAFEIFVKSLSTDGFELEYQAPLPEQDEIETRLSEHLEPAFKRSDLLNNDSAMKDVLHSAAQQTNSILKDNDHLG